MRGARGRPAPETTAVNHPSLRACLATLAAVAALTACGGGGGGGESNETPPAVVEKPATREEAARFLAQATFGPTEADIDRVMALGYAAWIDEQLATPRSGTHRAHWEARDAEIKAADATRSAGQDQVFESFWKQAVTGPDQLRQRAAYALSQIFVISLVDGNVGNDSRAVAAWLDMLADQGLGPYRTLLESVSRNPQMGIYLSHLRNQKADARTGRVPDENYAREVMQLFSIGLVELNEDGTPRGGSSPVETYTPADISGLAKVFTGFSWACPVFPASGCFSGGSSGGQSDPDRGFKPMVGYPAFHATEAKTFLGTTIPAQTTADPDASLRVALDAIAAHPNVGPFIGRQLIQRLVTSNPSPPYVAAVAKSFKDSGGDMKAMLRAVLLHPEARARSDTAGKAREPVLKLSAFLRAFGFRSDSGNFRVGNTDNPGTALGQTPLRSPSVFNFYRPGYVAPGTGGAARGLVAPELQIASETSAAGYVNYMRDNVASGVGQSNPAPLNRRDLQGDFAAELALATDVPALVDRALAKLAYVSNGGAPALKTTIVDAVNTITIPALNGTGSNQAQVDAAKRTRVNAAILLVLASPEFNVQK
jgi:uncharacterized protein (DUF1800 family)